MISFVLIASILNLFLGAALALLMPPIARNATTPASRSRAAVVEQPEATAKALLSSTVRSELPAEEVEPTATAPMEEETEVVSPSRPFESSDEPGAPIKAMEEPRYPKFVMEDLSPSWVQQLEADSVEAKSLVEASSLVLRLEVGKYRENLVRWEDTIRAIPEADFGDKIRGPIGSLVQLNEEWLKVQGEAVNVLSGKAATLDSFRDLSDRMEEVLLGQTSQIESTANNLIQMRTSDPPAQLRTRIVREVQRLLDLAHLLRDAIQSTLLTIFIAERRIERAEERLRVDSHTQLLSPIGMGGVFEHWKQYDPSRHKPACFGMIALNQFRNLNEELGARKADALLAAVARLCAETIRRDRGFDRIARSSGDMLSIFYGDTTIRTGVTAVERLRQTLQQTTFVIDEKEYKIGVTASIAAQLKGDLPADTMKRAADGMRFAKARARDRLVIDEGNGREVVDPPPVNVKSLKIDVMAGM